MPPTVESRVAGAEGDPGVLPGCPTVSFRGHIAGLWFYANSPRDAARYAGLARMSAGRVTCIAVCHCALHREWGPLARPFPFHLTTVIDDVYEGVPTRRKVHKLRQALDDVDPDVLCVIGYSAPEMRFAARWGKQRGKLVVMMGDTYREERPRRWWRETVKRAVVRRDYDAAFVAGPRSAEYAISLGVPPECVAVGIDVIDNAHVACLAGSARNREVSLREQLGLPARFFLYVGRLSPEKNLAFLLGAYHSYRERAGSDAWDLVLVGSGPEEHGLRGATKRAGTPGLHWPGFKQMDELAAYYALADCFVLPSLREGWSLVVNEAMACGLPVLASYTCGCVAEGLVQPGRNGLIFSPYDADALAADMALLSSGSLDLGGMGRASLEIIAGFTPETWAHDLLSLINTAHQFKAEMSEGRGVGMHAPAPACGGVRARPTPGAMS